MSVEATGESGLFGTIGRALWRPRGFFGAGYPFESRIPAVLVCAIANGLTGVGGAGLAGVLPWPDGSRSILYLFGAATGAFIAGAAVSVPMLYLSAGMLHVFSRLVGVRSEFAVTRDISGYATAPFILNIIPLLALISVPWNWLLTASAMRNHYGFRRWRWIAAVVGIDLALYAAKPLIPRAFFDVVKMPSSGMLPTIIPDQKLVVSKFSYLFTSPERGDIIAYEGTNENGYRVTHISRVVGLPGESVGFREDRLAIDDRPVPACSVKGVGPSRSGPISDALEVFVEELPGRRHWLGRGRERSPKEGDAPYLVGRDEVMVAGDAREQSGARRAVLNLSRIEGKVWFAVGHSGFRLERVNDEPRLATLSTRDALELSDCIEARAAETERSRESPAASGEAEPLQAPAPQHHPADSVREALAKRPNDFTPSPQASMVVLQPVPKAESPEGVAPPAPESLARYDVFLVDAHRLLQVTHQGTTPLGTRRWVAPNAMARLDDEIFLVDDGHLWSVTLKGEITQLGSRPWPADSLLTAHSGTLYGYTAGHLVVVGPSHGGIQRFGRASFPTVRALSHFDGPFVVDEKGLVALSPVGEVRQRTPGNWSGKTLMAPFVNGVIVLHSNALWRHNVYINDLERYGTGAFAGARGLAVSNTHVFVAYETSLVEVTTHGTKVRTVAPLRAFQAIAQ